MTIEMNTEEGVLVAERVTAQREPNTRTSLSALEWSALVEQIQSGDDGGMEQLYRMFSRGIRYYMYRQLGPQELEDKIHDVFLIVVGAIRRGELREPERLMGFVRTIVRRQVAAHIDFAVQARREQTDVETGSVLVDRGQNPEQAAIIRQKANLMRSSLQELSTRDREILVRFYLKEETQEQICSDMGLSDTQFRLLKSRAKAKFGEIGRKKLAKSGMIAVLLRAQAS